MLEKNWFPVYQAFVRSELNDEFVRDEDLQVSTKFP